MRPWRWLGASPMPRRLQATALPVPMGRLAEWPRTPLGFCWQPSCSCRGLVPTWSHDRGCLPASTKASTTVGARYLGRAAGPPGRLVALDERDQEVHQVLRYLVACLQTITPECGRTALALL